MYRTACTLLCAAALLVLSSCSGNHEGQSTAPGANPTSGVEANNAPEPGLSPEAEAALEVFRGNLKQELAVAAGIPLEQFVRMAQSATAPAVEDHQNQPLTLLLICEYPDAELIYTSKPDMLREEFRFAKPGLPNSAELVKWSLSSRELQRDHGVATYLQTSGIGNIDAELEGRELQGKATFQAPELFAGTVEFTASWRDGRWQITQFRLPARQIITSRQADGTWRSEGYSVSLGMRVALPRVDAAFARDGKSFPRFVVWLEATDEGTVSHHDGQRRSEDQITEQAETFTRQQGESLADAVVEIRADRRVPSQSVSALLERLSDIGFRKISLAAVTENGSVRDLWLDTSRRPTVDAPETTLPIRIRALSSEDGMLAGLRMGDRVLPSTEVLAYELMRLTNSEPTAEQPPITVELSIDQSLQVRYLADILQRVSAYTDADGNLQPIAGRVTLEVEP